MIYRRFIWKCIATFIVTFIIIITHIEPSIHGPTEEARDEYSIKTPNGADTSGQERQENH